MILEMMAALLKCWARRSNSAAGLAGHVIDRYLLWVSGSVV
jgi:hypothetical protein